MESGHGGFSDVFKGINPFAEPERHPLTRMPEIRKMPVSEKEYAYHQRLIDQVKCQMVDVFQSPIQNAPPATHLTFSTWLSSSTV
jgi:hypothetical protein